MTLCEGGKYPNCNERADQRPSTALVYFSALLPPFVDPGKPGMKARVVSPLDKTAGIRPASLDYEK